MKITVHGNQVNYRLDGPPSAPVIMLSHSLATNLTAWDPQVDALTRSFRVLCYDTLGHGGTDVRPGPYTLDQLAGQAGGLLDALGIERVHFLGLSMGGMIGQTLALMRPQSLTSLILCGASSRIPPEAQPLWQERIKIAESEGMAPLIEPTIGRWFTPSFRATHAEVVERVRGMIRATSPLGYSACCHAIAALNLTARIHTIRIPTLLIVGEQDQGMPVAVSRAIHDEIAGSELVILPSASHLSNLEQTVAFNLAVTSYLDRLE
ncbi:MAG: 3-oxoadipate enol-lactonase [Acidobacteriia bacterium]|nr:3-oxoadipate enol-lactonase [Terriglobia bacterium]